VSRHLLLDRPDRQIVLGYDHMLRSFFGQVFRPNDRRREGMAVDGWPTKSGLGTRRPVDGHPEAARDLGELEAWAHRQLIADGSFGPETRAHAQRLREILLFEWDDGDDAAEIPLPACLKGSRA